VICLDDRAGADLIQAARHGRLDHAVGVERGRSPDDASHRVGQVFLGADARQVGQDARAADPAGERGHAIYLLTEGLTDQTLFLGEIAGHCSFPAIPVSNLMIPGLQPQAVCR